MREWAWFAGSGSPPDAGRALVQVQWADDAERFDLKSAAVVAAVAELEVPAISLHKPHEEADKRAG